MSEYECSECHEATNHNIRRACGHEVLLCRRCVRRVGTVASHEDDCSGCRNNRESGTYPTELGLARMVAEVEKELEAIGGEDVE